MASFEETRQILETRFLNGRAADATLSDIPVFFESREVKQPTGKDWIIMSIDDAGSSIQSFTGSRRLDGGVVAFHIYCPHGSGTKRIRQVADKIDSVMSFTGGTDGINSSTTLYCQAGNLRRISEDENGYLSYVITFPFKYWI